MQKYLHSSKQIAKRKGRVILVCLLAAAVCALVSVNKNAAELGGNNGRKTLYMAESLPDKQYKNSMYLQTETKKTDCTEKMNNLVIENSKTFDFENDKVKMPQTRSLAKEINVIDKDGSIKRINLEDFVLGCLIGEMPLSFHPQALMAQCVAIRSFTVNKLEEGSKHPNAASCINPSCCQCYLAPTDSGYDKSLLDKARTAVEATRGVVAVYDGKVINAVYHAVSNGKTKDSKQVWGGSVDYLKSVKSPDGEAQICFSSYNGNGGHGVGMSQQGANLLAGEGYSYVDILTYYYSGISFEMLSEQNFM